MDEPLLLQITYDYYIGDSLCDGEEHGNIKTDLSTWLQSQNASIEFVKQLESNIYALRNFAFEIQKGIGDLWLYIVTDVKDKCLSIISASWDSLKLHFIELCSCLCKSCSSLVKANFADAKRNALDAIDHIIYFVDILSYIPALNVIVGVVLFILYLVQNQWGQAILAIVFMIPFLKWFKKVPFLKIIIGKVESLIKKMVSRLKINNTSNVIDITNELKKKKTKLPVTESNISVGKTNGKIINIEYARTIKKRREVPDFVMQTGTNGGGGDKQIYYLRDTYWMESKDPKSYNPQVKNNVDRKNNVDGENNVDSGNNPDNQAKANQKVWDYYMLGRSNFNPLNINH